MATPVVKKTRIKTKRKWKWQLTHSARLLLGSVFLTAALTKGIDIIRFGRQIETIAWILGLPATEMVRNWAMGTAFFVLASELLIGTGLISGVRARGAAISGMFLLILFAGITVWSAASGVAVECGCFGTVVTRTAGEAVADDVILLLIGIFAVRRRKPERPFAKMIAPLLIVGLAWGILFYAFPRRGSALRTGVEVSLPNSIPLSSADSLYYLWFFDPDCSRCQMQLGFVKEMAGVSSRVFGITASTHGRVNEFKFDYEANFPIISLQRVEYARFGVHDGTFVELAGSRVKRLWEGTIPPMRQVLKETR